jgi:cyclic di-GMP phosphodiesterase
MVAGEDSPKLAMTAIEQGAYGYLVKPVKTGELLINVANALHRRRLELDNGRLVQRLQATVDDRSHELEEALRDLELSETKVWVSQAETIFRLARLVEFRDEETGHHLHRMSSYCGILARGTGFSEQRCELVRLASQLHDVGKVAVPDSILLKHGKLTPEEFEVVKGHAETGFQMLSGGASEVVQLGALIARTHHERWDGSGYPRGLAGNDIPAEGRIAAVADVFDALTSDRVYRPALPVKSAIEMMRDERGHHFDPELLDAFLLALPEIEAIRQAYAD